MGVDAPFWVSNFNPQTVFFKGAQVFQTLGGFRDIHIDILDTSWNFGPWLLCCQQSVDILPNGRAKMQKPREKTAALTADDYLGSVDPGWFSRRKQSAIQYLWMVFKLNAEGWTRQVMLEGIIIHDRYSWHTLTSCYQRIYMLRQGHPGYLGPYVLWDKVRHVQRSLKEMDHPPSTIQVKLIELMVFMYLIIAHGLAFISCLFHS